MVDSNEVIGNQYSGIAIDRGYNNTITKNIISENPNGIELWEGDGIPPYQNQYSKDYFIYDNHIEGNSLALKAENTEHLVFKNNSVEYNNNGILLSGDTTEDTISGNSFVNTCFYHVENQSSADIYAIDNSWGFTDEELIAANIWDKNDNPALGEVLWDPFVPVADPMELSNIIEDMAEPNANWYAYPEACWGYDSSFAPATSWDYTDYVVGQASIHHQTGNGWDVGLQYWPETDTMRTWSLSLADTLIFYLKTKNNTGYGFQFHHVRVGNNKGGYYRFSNNASPLNAANGQWKKIEIPLAGGGTSGYSKSQVGEVSLDEINYVAVHADTWEFGFEIWLDGVHFTQFGVGEKEPRLDDNVSIYPNPVIDNLSLDFYLENDYKIEIYSPAGEKIDEKTIRHGNHTSIDLSSVAKGIYIVKLSSVNIQMIRKIVKI
jgi:parallel beta-helix repeat protein